MSKFSPSGISGVANSPQPLALVGATTLQIANVTCTLAGTEYSYTFPSNTRKFKLRARGMSKVQVADTTGATASTFFSIWPGECFEDDALTTSETIYFQVSKPAEVIEIFIWT